MDSICMFASTKSVKAEINIINFVYEKNVIDTKRFITQAGNSICLVTKGCGNLITNYATHSLKAGDIFLICSAKQFRIEEVENLNYIYITFIGKLAQEMLDKIILTNNSPVKEGFDFLIDTWIKSINDCTNDNINLLCEGLLLQAFAYLIKRETIPNHKTFANNFLNLKSFVDLNYNDVNLNLKLLSQKFWYSEKYISNAFFKLVKKPFSKYITTLRLEHAIKLMDSGYKNVGTVANLCGFSDQFYFSKVFKKEYNVSPKNYIMRVASAGTYRT